MTTKFGIKKLETSFCCVLQNVYRYFEPLWQGLRVWRTDGQTDGPLLTVAQSTDPR